jgi:hypothetical protein
VAQASQPEPVILGSAAPATESEITRIADQPKREQSASQVALAEQETLSEAQASPGASSQPPGHSDHARSAVLQALTDANQRILASTLSSGEWSIQGNELVIKVAESQTVVDMSLGSEGKRIAIAAASGALGRAMKLKVIPGATVQEKKNGALRNSAGPGGRGRAEQDPIVRRMQEKFGAQIRTVIDHREKR